MKDSESLKAIELKEKLKDKRNIEKLFESDSDVEDHEEENEKKGDLNHMMINGISDMNVKISIMLIFLYIILNSEIFIDNILSKIDGTLVDGKTTNRGVFVSAILLAFGYILIDLIF